MQYFPFIVVAWILGVGLYGVVWANGTEYTGDYSRATDDDIASLWRAHQRLAEVAAHGDVDGYFWANVAFRDEELRVSRNGIFKEVLDSMRMRTNRLRHLSTTLPGRLQRSCADHQRLCEAYAERDGTLADNDRASVQRNHAAQTQHDSKNWANQV